MKKIYINESGPVVSAAIYGFWRWNEEDFRTEDHFNNVIKLTKELGITTYDLSPSFANGRAEEYFGKAITSGLLNREEIVISTKAGIRKFSNGKGNYYDLSPSYLQQSLDESLVRLKVDSIDVFILEHFDHLYNFEQTASALLKFQRKGKIKHIGLSNFNVFQQRLLSTYLSQPIITNHLELNLLHTSALNNGQLDFIKEQHSKPMAFSPLADGRILEGEDAQAVKLRAVLSEVATKYDANIEQIAAAWVNKIGAIPIIGSKDLGRIKNAATAQKIDLTGEDWYYLYNATLS